MKRLELKLIALENIDEVFDNLQKFENKRDEVKSELKQKYDHQIKALNKRKEELQAIYKAIENATDDNWKETTQTYSESLKHLRAGFMELEKLF